MRAYALDIKKYLLLITRNEPSYIIDNIRKIHSVRVYRNRSLVQNGRDEIKRD